jgi:GH18 family chitinase
MVRVEVDVRTFELTTFAVNFAFALISPTFAIMEMSPGDADLWLKTTALKQRNSALQVWLSIGGWSFNDPPTSHVFSDLVASAENTRAFLADALAVMEVYGFDGIDMDWEYPVAAERGGNPADKENYVTFMKAARAAFGSKYGISFTAPSSYWV